ncbi:MAG: hypothetical protein M3332_04015 [Actinomycetota bacterium]|nr:hypothetical protein [Actinomycetota bacterium]
MTWLDVLGMRRASRGPHASTGSGREIAAVTAVSAAGGLLLARVLPPFALTSVTVLTGGTILG